MSDQNDHRTQNGFGHLSRPRRPTTQVEKIDGDTLGEEIQKLRVVARGADLTAQVEKERRTTAEDMGIKGGQGKDAEDVRNASHFGFLLKIAAAITVLAAIAWFFVSRN